MPKRGYPFAAAVPLQLKTRVGLRELSRGVCAERYSREIFEKTRQLLFRGAQAYAEHVWEDACAVVDLPESPKPGPTTNARVSRGQMLIGPDGRLTRRPEQISDTDPLGAVLEGCQSCAHGLVRKALCGQCERALCGACVHACSSCGTTACTLCAVVEGADIPEKLLCASCAMFEG